MSVSMLILLVLYTTSPTMAQMEKPFETLWYKCTPFQTHSTNTGRFSKYCISLRYKISLILVFSKPMPQTGLRWEV